MMLYALIPAALLTLAAIALALLFRREFSQLLAPVVFSVILLLYGFYIAGALFPGRIVILLLFLMLYVFAAIFLLRQKSAKPLTKILTSPAFAVYLAALAVFFLFSANKFVSLWDCLRLWGAYPKALHTTGALQLGKDSLLYASMQSYPPGMPLLVYFFTSFSPVFNESTLFFVYSFFGLCLMLPFLQGSRWENKRPLPAILLAIIFVPYFITGMNTDDGYYYSSLFIDIPLGICCGYFFSRVLHPKNTLDRICAVLSCGVLVLLKDSGAFMAICGIFGGLLCGLLRKQKGSILWTLPSLAMLAFTYGSWKYLLSVFTVSNHLSLQFSIPSFVTLARIFFHLLRTPVSGIFTVTGAVHVSLPAGLLILFCGKLLLARHNKTVLLKEEIADVAVQFLCYAGFFLGYCFSFLDSMENQLYPSYARYFCTLLTCALYILVHDCCFRHRDFLRTLAQEISSRISPESPLSGILASARVILRTGMVLAMAFSAVLILFDFPSKQSAFYVQGKESAAVLAESAEEGSVVYLCMPSTVGDTSRMHHRIYFEMLDEQIRIQNYFSDTNITHTGLAYTAESFMEHLIQNSYDYVMLTGVDALLMEEFGDFFPDMTLDSVNLLYRIDYVNRQLVRIP